MRRVIPATVVVGVIGALGWIFVRRQTTLPGPDSSEYKKMATAFNIGLLALQNGDDERALQQLTLATTIVPLEPAGWADLGVFQLRSNKLDEAAKSFEKARELAPNNAQIEALLGLLKQQTGDFDAAIKHYERAVELDPNDLRARYALFGAYSQSGAAGADAKALEQIEAILKAQPNNQAALLEAARLAAKRGDAPALKAAIASLQKRSDAWNDEARAQLKELQAAAATPRAATTPIVFLNNLLKPLPIYQDDLAQISSGGASAPGEPLTKFIALAPLEPKAPAPDLKSTFTAQTVKIAPGIYGAARAFYASDKAPSQTLYNDGKSVILVGGKAGFSFPGAAVATANEAMMAPIDWNSDFQTDLVLAGDKGVKFYQAQGANFNDATAKTNLKPDVLGGNYTGAYVADIEADGDLDIVLARAGQGPIELRNNGNNTFTALPIFASIKGVRAWAWADLDNDGDNDAAIIDDAGTLHLMNNDRSGKFSERAVPKDLGAVAAIAVGDLDSDGNFDLLVLKDDGVLVKLSDLNGTTWTTIEEGKYAGFQKGKPSRLLIADLDNNSEFDIVASNGIGTQVWMNGGGKFTALGAPLNFATFDVADLNNDGRLDLIGTDGRGGAAQMMGGGPLKYGWLDIRAHSKQTTGDGRINSYGIGGSMELRTVLQYSRQPLDKPIAHFGLGEEKCADALRITWPNGDTQAEFALCSGKDIVALQRLTGSCPYLWAWDGTKFAFVKDVNWRSPLGLKINSQDTAGVVQTEDWAHLRGDQLQARDGKYDLRVTADLWEAHYFDNIELMTVDHPADTRVWVDERFSIPMPPLKVVVTGAEQPVKSARDDKGRDVSAKVSALDEDYLDCGRAQYQGVTADHWLEIELPKDAPLDKPLWLLAQGWLHPTDSSINVALAQNGGNLPRDLALEVADGRGGWKVVQPHMGFPSGKFKTMTIPLQNAFVPGAPRRLRLRTNLEIYWDKISWAVDRSDAKIVQHKLLPSRADLHFRGYSNIAAPNPASPEVPLSYATNGQTQRWRDLVGFYTRFGDVKPLLERTDDHYVIMNAGDELKLQFDAPALSTANYVRDTVFITDGWTKDGNMNTTFSTTLLPLPAHNLPQTDAPPGRLQDDPVYRRNPQDWTKYHTRWVGTKQFRSAMRVGLE